MPNILDTDTMASIITRIKSLSPEEKGRWGLMNANQMLCHTTDQLRISLGDLAPGPGRASFIGRTLLKFMVLHVIPIPKNVPTSPRVDQMKEGTKPTDFESDRNTLIEYIERFCSTPADFDWAPHFKFGKLNKKQWAILAAKHLDHHLRQFGA